MPEFVIEREIPGAGSMSEEELQAIAKKSVGVLKEMGPAIKWLHSYVTGDKVYCAPAERASLSNRSIASGRESQSKERIFIATSSCLAG
jgi:hypothetical protein